MNQVETAGGWSLIELLVVLFIMGFLLTLAIPDFEVVLSKSDDMGRSQLLLEALADTQLQLQQSQGQVTVQQACQNYMEREEDRFFLYALVIECQIDASGEIMVKGQYDGQVKLLSSVRGFVD